MKGLLKKENKMDVPLLSVCLLTYNHNKFIRQAIDGILMQKVNFTWELIIADDFSTDGTREIVIEYKQKYPDFIKLILQEKNVGAIQNFLDLLITPKFKYIAFLEGDDYWIDPLKLQKQVDFLEENPDYSLCFHDAIILWEDKSQPPKYFCSKDQKETPGIEDVINNWFIPSASMVFRKKHLMPLPDWFKNIYNEDWALHMILANKKKIYYINEIMSIYRKNEGAFSGGIGKNTEFVNNKKIELLRFFNQHSNYAHKILIEKKTTSLIKDIREYKLKKKFPVIYHLLNPVKAFKKVIRKIAK